MELPKNFTDKMIDLLGENADDFFASLDKPSAKAITINYNKIQPELLDSLMDFDHKSVEGVPNGFTVEGLKVSTHILNHLGIIYSQEPSAMLPVEMLDIKPGDIVLDISAAPGGKSVQILEKLSDTGVLVSNEIVYSRAKILYENITRMGFRNSVITSNSPADYEKANILFDKILVDAPCGGEGMFRKNNFDMKAYNLTNIETNATRQLNILNSLKDRLRRGGRLVYSTCTYDVRENEGVIVKFLEDNPDFHLIKPETRFDNITTNGVKIENYPTEYCKRRYPHLFIGEGQFMAILEKDGEENIEDGELITDNISPLYRKDLHDINRETKDILDISELNLYKRNDTIYHVPKNISLDLRGLNIVSIGTVFGTLSKTVLKINHAFYHTYGELFTNTIDLNDKQVYNYLSGLEIDSNTDIKGIVSVTYKGLPLGGGKLSNGKLKNYYPKELRV